MDKPERLVIEDVETVKMLAQPARYRAVEELYTTQRPTTATRLAALAGVTPSAMSYHLRELDRHGVIRRVEESSTDGRERLWEASALVYEILVSDYSDPAGRLAVLDAYLSPMRERMAAVLGERAAAGPGGRYPGHTVLATGRLLLTDDEQLALNRELAGVWRRYEQLSWGREEAPGLAGSVYLWSLLPVDERPGGAPMPQSGAQHPGGAHAALAP